MKPHELHRAKGERRLRAVLVTVSTSRFALKRKGEDFSDESGDAAKAEVSKLGHRVERRELVSDEVKAITGEAERFLAGGADLLVFMGGTGVSNRDVTIEAVKPFFEKELDGFGELLRSLSYRRVGSASALTRATAGVAKGKLILCLPGSPDAVRVAFRTFGKELAHIIFVARS